MACVVPTHCQPCTECGAPLSGEPVPACPPLVDGTYTNVTLVIENGCIVSVQTGDAPLYSPDVCCAPVGIGGGGSGLDGSQGPPGVAATVTPGTVTSLPYGSAPTVTNSGSPTNAILDFGIPRGEPGDDGDSVTGATSSDGGIDLDNGVIKTIPVTWPPVLTIGFVPSAVVGVVLGSSKDPLTGAVTLTVDLGSYASAVDTAISGHETRIGNLESVINRPQSFTVATLPSALAAGAGQLVYVTDEVGGAVPAFSDGVNWLRVTDRAIVS
jgi:hypothetical protein